MKHEFSPRQENYLRPLLDSYASKATNLAMAQCLEYLNALLHYNKAVSLISRAGDEWQQAYELLATSLEALAVLPVNDSYAILDIGSGGGFPAIPLKIARPEGSVYCVELKQRKCTVLETIAARLGLTGFEVLCQSYEDLNVNQLAERIVVTSRAGPSPIAVASWAGNTAEVGQIVLYESSLKTDIETLVSLLNEQYLVDKKSVGTSLGIDSLVLLSLKKQHNKNIPNTN